MLAGTDLACCCCSEAHWPAGHLSLWMLPCSCSSGMAWPNLQQAQHLRLRVHAPAASLQQRKHSSASIPPLLRSTVNFIQWRHRASEVIESSLKESAQQCMLNRPRICKSFGAYISMSHGPHRAGTCLETGVVICAGTCEVWKRGHWRLNSSQCLCRQRPTSKGLLRACKS